MVIGTGSLKVAGLNSYYWLATAYPSVLNAYILYFDQGIVLPSRFEHHLYGFTVQRKDLKIKLKGWGTDLDRKAVPTIVAVRRGDVSAIEIEVVRIELRLVGGTIPVVASAARGPQRASSHIHEPATS